MFKMTTSWGIKKVTKVIGPLKNIEQTNYQMIAILHET